MTRLPLLALLALAACATVPPPVAASPTAGFGQVASAGQLLVRPLALLEDSRCPAAVQCVWAGQVRISAEITDAMGTGQREFTVGKPVVVVGGTVTLVGVDPPRLAPGYPDRRDYRFTFTFQGTR